MRLHNLRSKNASRHRPKRVGRGPGSGHGKTATKGHKGQLARSGGGKGPGFEGGQQPLIRRAPKRGFRVVSPDRWVIVSIGKLALLTGDPQVNPERLRQAGVIKRSGAKIKVLGDGELARALTVSAHAFSASAKAKIEAAGGTAHLIEAGAAR
ncbi:MAG: 50S ribosomal protein L15 [Nitrospirota bacterium]